MEPADRVSADARAAARGTLALAGAQTAARLFGLVFILVATRELAPNELARYSVVAAVALIAGALADLGTTTVITRRVSQTADASESILSGTLLASLLLGLVAYAVAVAFAFATSYSPPAPIDMLIGGAALPLDSMLTSVLGALDGRGLIAQRSLLSFSRTVVASLGAAVALLAGLGIRWPLAALPAGSAVALVAAAAYARHAGVWTIRLTPEWQRSKELLREALPFAALGGMHVLILRFDVVVLSVLSSPTQTAQYDVAGRAVDAISYVGAAVAAPSLFLLSRRLGAGDRQGAGRAFTEAVRVTYLIGLPVSAGLVAVHSQATSVVFGASYKGTAVPLAILGAQLWLFFLAGTQGSLILAAGLAVPALRIVAVNVTTIVVLDVVLIAVYDAVGAAVAMALCQVVAVVLFAFFIRQRLRLKTPWPPPRVVLAAVGAGLVAWPAAGVSLALGIAAGLLVYPAALLITRELAPADLQRLIRIVR